MKIKVLFFGVLTDVTGHENLAIENAKSVEELKDQLKAKFPNLKDHEHLIAVNQNIVKENISLNDGDEVALLPPYSGG